MNDFIASFYEGFFYNSDYAAIFDYLLYVGGPFNGYNVLALIFIMIPVIIWSYFYFGYKRPTAGFGTWLLWLLSTALIAGLLSYWFLFNRIFSAESLGSGAETETGSIVENLINSITDPTTGYKIFANRLIIYLSLYNALLASIVSIVYSFIVKHWSKQFIHLPF